MAGDTPLTMPVKAQRGITLRHAARRFAACAKGDDVHVEDFAEATEQMMTIVERFGSFTKRGAPWGAPLTSPPGPKPLSQILTLTLTLTLTPTLTLTLSLTLTLTLTLTRRG